MSKIKEQTYTYKDMNVFYASAGDAANGAIVLLHPAFGDHRIWKHQLAYFSKDYFVIAVDMVGHGKSQVNRQSVTMGEMPEIVKSILEAHGKTNAHLIGVSLGSLVAQGVAYVYPELAKSVTVVGGYSIHKNNEHIAKAQRKEMGKWIIKILFSMKRFRKYIVDVSVHSAEGKAAMTDGAALFKRSSFRAMSGTDRFMQPMDEKMPYPLLAIAGEHDMQLAINAAQQLAMDEDGRYEMITGAGHCANIDAPEAFNEVLEGFVQC